MLCSLWDVLTPDQQNKLSPNRGETKDLRKQSQQKPPSTFRAEVTIGIRRPGSTAHRPVCGGATSVVISILPVRSRERSLALIGIRRLLLPRAPTTLFYITVLAAAVADASSVSNSSRQNRPHLWEGQRSPKVELPEMTEGDLWVWLMETCITTCRGRKSTWYSCS